jgi:hypothetical protein
MHRPILGFGLAIGLLLGCKGPSGVDGLCDLLSGCVDESCAAQCE